MSARFRISKITIRARLSQVRLRRRMTIILMWHTRYILVLRRTFIRHFLIMRLATFCTRRLQRIITQVLNISRPFSITRVMFLTLFRVRMSVRVSIISRRGHIIRSFDITMARFIMFNCRRILIINGLLFRRFLNTRCVTSIFQTINLLRHPISLIRHRYLITYGSCVTRPRLLTFIRTSIRCRITDRN